MPFTLWCEFLLNKASKESRRFGAAEQVGRGHSAARTQSPSYRQRVTAERQVAAVEETHGAHPETT